MLGDIIREVVVVSRDFFPEDEGEAGFFPKEGVERISGDSFPKVRAEGTP